VFGPVSLIVLFIVFVIVIGIVSASFLFIVIFIVLDWLILGLYQVSLPLERRNKDEAKQETEKDHAWEITTTNWL